MQTRLDSISVKVDERFGLRHVNFRCNGVVEFPTALNSKCSISSDPRFAWRGGVDSIKLPVQYAYDNSRKLMLYETETVVALDGSPLEEDPASPKLLRKFIKNVDFPLPGCVDMTQDGAVLSPPTTRQIPATVEIYLIGEKLANDSTVVHQPYQVKRWADYGARAVPSKTLVATSESGGARGYLAGVAWSGFNGIYKGMQVESYTSWVHSTPSYLEYIGAIKQGQYVNVELLPLLTTVNGKTLYILQKIFLKYDFSTDFKNA